MICFYYNYLSCDPMSFHIWHRLYIQMHVLNLSENCHHLWCHPVPNKWASFRLTGVILCQQGTIYQYCFLPFTSMLNVSQVINNTLRAKLRSVFLMCSNLSSCRHAFLFVFINSYHVIVLENHHERCSPSFVAQTRWIITSPTWNPSIIDKSMCCKLLAAR